MRLLVLLVLLPLLASKETYTLKYRFPKGLVYVDKQAREVAVETLVEKRSFRLKVRQDSKLKRTIVAADHNEKPTIERVEVLTLGHTVVEHPEIPTGTRKKDSQGKTFVWRRLKARWGLFDGSDADVTKRYPYLVSQLKNWRDARLPKGKVAVGDEWLVPARAYLETSGQDVVPGVEGVASFKLMKVEEGVAHVSFDAVFTYRIDGTYQSVKAKGIWRFDIANGRDLSFEMTGEIKINQGRGGKGFVSMKREVTYP